MIRLHPVTPGPGCHSQVLVQDEGHPPILRLGAQRQVGILESVPIPVCIPVPILGLYPRSAFQVYIPSVVLQVNAVGSAVGCGNPHPRELAFSHFL